MRKILFSLSLTLFFGSCLKDGSFKKEYRGFEPALTGDGWLVSTPEAEHVDRGSLEQAYALLYSDERFLMARSMLVIRNGKLIAEAYPNDISDRDRYANIQSCTKSFTSIMTGVAIQDGQDVSLDEKLYDVYPELFDKDLRKREIRLKDALSMRTGLEFNNEKNTLGLYQTRSGSASFVLSFPWLNEPGTVMNYNDGAPHLVSKFLEVKTGRTLAEYAREKLFEPLGITDWKWESAKDGTTFGAFSLYLKPRDFAKVGQLLLRNGEWEGLQIIDPEYLAEATTALTSQRNKAYGYYFWIDERNQGYAAHGHGGQVLLVAPSENLVLLYTAWPYTSGDFFDDAFEMFNIIVDGCE